MLMYRYRYVDTTTGRTIGCFYAKSLHSAQCLAPRVFKGHWSRFNRVFSI